MEKPEWPAKQWDEQLRQRLQHEPLFEPAAWDAMLARLEVAMPAFPNEFPSYAVPEQKKGKRKRIAFIWYAVAASLTALLMVAGLWWVISDDSAEAIRKERGLAQQQENSLRLEEDNRTPASQEPQNSLGAQDKAAAAAEDLATTAQAETIAPRDMSKELSDKEQGIADPQHMSGGESFEIIKAPAVANTDDGQAKKASAAQTAAMSDEGSESLAYRSSEEPVPGPKLTTSEATLRAAGKGKLRSVIESNEGLPGLASLSYQFSQPVIRLKAPEAMAARSETAATGAVVVQKRSRPAGRRWSLALAGTPDMSQVGSLSTTKPGWGGGLLVGYRLGNRLQLGAGAIYTMKNYESYESFVPYDGMGSGYYAPDQIDASCSVLDLPLNVQYQFARSRRLRWYASAGLSSYLMLSEYYNFQYKYYNYEYTYKNENRHWLGVLNAGVGVELPLFNRIKLQAEPYFKLPIHGVGAGQIRLTSFGTLLQLRYEL